MTIVVSWMIRHAVILKKLKMWNGYDMQTDIFCSEKLKRANNWYTVNIVR